MVRKYSDLKKAKLRTLSIYLSRKVAYTFLGIEVSEDGNVTHRKKKPEALCFRKGPLG